jgi:hypothetical protein
MPKFTFIGEHTDLYGKPDGTKITYEFEVDGLENLLEHADLFIRGCGYNPAGQLDFVEELVEPTMEDWNKVHSQYFFDTERNK